MGNGWNSWGTISDSTKKENILIADGEYFLNSISKLRLGSWNYKTQDPKDFRHYGPMAQEIFHYFGKDKYGTIGCDTLLSSSDMDGIMMIALQALEKRTDDLRISINACLTARQDLRFEKEKNAEMGEQLSVIGDQLGKTEKENKEMKTRLAKLEKMFKTFTGEKRTELTKADN